MKLFICLLSLSLCFTSLNAQGIASPKAEDGVSYDLAVYRKKIISDIRYQLHAALPEDKTAPIDAEETLSFSYKKQNNASLQIDFKADSNSVKSIVVNDIAVKTNYHHEHIIIDAKYLKNGYNKIGFTFIAGSTALNRRTAYLYTLFVPDHARTMFPCFDQPDLKARFLLSLTIPEKWTAIANGRIKDSLMQNGQKTYQFSISDILPTYLFAFAAGDFKTHLSDFGHNKITLLYKETDTAKINSSIDSIFSLYKNSIGFYQRWTGLSYPFQHYGMVAVPDFQFGGMEHPGNILLQNATLFLNKDATQNQLNARSNLIAHEVAHQWFGDMVTMKWFSDVWMKEVFANFMADKSTAASTDRETYNLKFLTTHFPSAYAVDRTAGANPIRQPLDNLQNAGMLYGPVIYDKAPVMMRQLELLMGEENFRKGVDEYLKEYAYANASWPDLIKILGAHTSEDLQSWNKVWVNETGRPVIDYKLKNDGNKISSLMVTQRPESGAAPKLWKQSFQVSLYYPDTIIDIPVHLSEEKQEIKKAAGKPEPLFVLLNSSGTGYGVFGLDSSMYKYFSLIKDPVSRAGAYISMYENMLDGKAMRPLQLLHFLSKQLQSETTELNLRLITGYLSSVYWEFISKANRLSVSDKLESLIWSALQQQAAKNNKKILFECYESIFQSQQAYDKLYNVWQQQTPPGDVVLNEDDYTSLALALSLRSNDNAALLQEQLARIKNPDRINRFKIIMQAASSDKHVRDAFFNGLAEKQNRSNESAVSAALAYLHHPLRQQTSAAYLKKSLAMLEEIKRTGDIFFPDNWLRATFGNYQNPQAMQVVSDFLAQHPQYNSVLKNKILQATDNLKRSQSLVKQQSVPF